MAQVAKKINRRPMDFDGVSEVRLEDDLVEIDLHFGDGSTRTIRGKPHVIIDGINQCQKAIVGRILPWWSPMNRKPPH